MIQDWHRIDQIINNSSLWIQKSKKTNFLVIFHILYLVQASLKTREKNSKKNIFFEGYSGTKPERSEEKIKNRN